MTSYAPSDLATKHGSQARHLGSHMARAQLPPHTSSMYPAVELDQIQLTSLLSAALGPSKLSTPTPRIRVVSLPSLPSGINTVYTRGNTASDAPLSTSMYSANPTAGCHSHVALKQLPQNWLT